VKEIDDEKQMLAVRSGDIDALVPLFDKYNARLYNFFLGMTRDKESSEDLAMQLFSRIIQYRHTFREDSRFKPWIYKMARNIHIDHYNKTRYMVKGYDVSVDFVNDKMGAIENMEKREQHEILNEALDLLPVDQREIIELSRFQDLKYEDISRITGSSVGAVKVKVHRAIKKLKELYFEIA
jgi:RNA polymerase sigma-70 factor (ECF subfamily)